MPPIPSVRPRGDLPAAQPAERVADGHQVHQPGIHIKILRAASDPGDVLNAALACLRPPEGDGLLLLVHRPDISEMGMQAEGDLTGPAGQVQQASRIADLRPPEQAGQQELRVTEPEAVRSPACCRAGRR
jgi:hypothetical protein